MTNQEAPKTSDRWTIRNVSEQVQTIVRVLAAERNCSVAEALEIIVSEWKQAKDTRSSPPKAD